MIIIAPATTLQIAAYNAANAQPMVGYRNLLAEGTLTNGLLPTGAPRADAVTESTAEYWLPATAPDTLRTTLGAAQNADFCFIGAHTLGTEGSTLTVQYFDGSTWQNIAAHSPSDDQPFMIVFPRRSAAGWGIQVSAAPAQVGVAFIGPRLIIPGGVQPDYQPIWATRRITKFPGTTRRGHFLGQRIERAGASVSASFMPIAHSFALTNMADFRNHFNDGRAFIWAPAPGIFTRDVAYCWAADDATFAPSILAGGDLVNLSLRMEAFAVA